MVFSVTLATAVRPLTSVRSRVTLVLPALYFSPLRASRFLRSSSCFRAAFSVRPMPEESFTLPEKPSAMAFLPPWLGRSTSALVRSVKTASAKLWKAALVLASTWGSVTVEAPAFQLGRSATPATADAAAAVNIVARRRVCFSFLDFTGVLPSFPGMGPPS
ncbi:hypothetical protein SMICM17S_11284 [Streptomyces microflavus]